MQWRKLNATALRKCHILEPPLNEAFMPNKSGIVSDLQFVDKCTNSVLLYFQSKREIIFKYTHKEMKNPFFLITKYFNLLNDKLSTRIRLNTNRCLDVFKSAERNDRICDFDQLISNFTLWNQQIFKSEWPLSKQQTFRESLQKKGFCTDWARQTSVENFGLVVVKRKKLLYCSDLLKHFSLCGSFRPAFHSNKIMFWIKSYLLVDFI